jgi:hypothetical protein
MATGSSGTDHSKGTTNQPKGNSGPGSPRIMVPISRKNNTGGKEKVNRKSVTVS